MTVEEAVKSIDDVLNSDYYYDESIGYQMTSDDFEWLEKSKEALEKQIPKEPTICDDDVFICPTCKTYIFVSDEFESHKFCLNCGQALDWSDTK